MTKYRIATPNELKASADALEMRPKQESELRKALAAFEEMAIIKNKEVEPVKESIDKFAPSSQSAGRRKVRSIEYVVDVSFDWDWDKGVPLSPMDSPEMVEERLRAAARAEFGNNRVDVWMHDDDCG